MFWGEYMDRKGRDLNYYGARNVVINHGQGKKKKFSFFLLEFKMAFIFLMSFVKPKIVDIFFFTKCPA